MEFPNGQEAKYSANMIVENMWAQCDLDGNQYLLLTSIVDHKIDGHKVEKANKHITVNGRSPGIGIPNTANSCYELNGEVPETT